MAKCETTKKTISVTLTLSEDEARVLGQILRYVGGSPAGWRGVADDIFYSMRSQGFGKEADPSIKILSSMTFGPQPIVKET